MRGYVSLIQKGKTTLGKPSLLCKSKPIKTLNKHKKLKNPEKDPEN
jgi:hypothetical protein